MANAALQQALNNYPTIALGNFKIHCIVHESSALI